MRLSDSPRTTTVLALIALAAALAAGGLALTNSPEGAPRLGGTVSVTGSATVVAQPDTLTADLTVTTKSTSSAAALGTNNTEMARLQQVFLKRGVKKSDLVTTNLSVGPNYDSKGRPSGYVVTDNLTVT